MKPSPFEYHGPSTVDEAVGVLAEVGHTGKVLAGGQSLVPILNMRLAAPDHLVDINGVAGLDTIEVTSSHVRVGALVRHARLEQDEPAYDALPLLRQALVNVAHPVIRNRGTTLGSIMHADPSGEMPAILALTGGLVEAASVRGTRHIPVGELFAGPLETTLAPDELAVAVRFDRFPAGTGTAFAEIARRHGDYALAGVAAAVQVADDGTIGHARAGFVSLTLTPSVLDLTAVLAGVPADRLVDGSTPALDQVRAAVAAHIEPDDDIHATGEYRTVLATTLIGQVLAEATRRSLAAGAATGPAPTSQETTR